MNQSDQIQLPFDVHSLLLEALGNAITILAKMAADMPWWFWALVVGLIVLRMLPNHQSHKRRRRNKNFI